MELTVWKGGWGVPSIEPKCIQAMSFVRFSGAPVTVKPDNNPLMSPRWKLKLPYFKKEDGSYLFEPLDMSSYLNTKNYQATGGGDGLEARQQAETVAYAKLIDESLYPALQYFFFAVETNFSDVIRPFYGMHLPWTCKLWYPQWMRSSAINFIESHFGEGACSTPKSIEPFIIKRAQSCLNDLSDKLDNKEFFFGTKLPTHLDGVVFSFVVLLSRIPLPYSPLREFLKTKHNLDRFVSKISQRYFPHFVGLGEELKFGAVRYGTYGEILKSDEVSFPLKNKVIALLAAAFAMLFYAYKTGLLLRPDNELLEQEINIHLEDDEDFEDE